MRIAGMLVIMLITLSAAYLLQPHVEGIAGVGALGEFYLGNSYLGERSAGSPEVVTSILWDYRGVDTYFETAVLFLAIISAVSVFRGFDGPKFRGEGFTEVVKTGVKLVAFITFVASASVAFHGHLTPGGGFQGGSMLAAGSLLIIVGFSKKALERNGITKVRALAIRTAGLVTIACVAAYPLLRGLHFMQNLPVYPIKVGGLLVSGSLLLYNLAEFLAVGAGFTIIFLLLANPEEGWQ
ncbi:Multisubunit Na+/H+ antiporter, MnhB subunit [Thermococcus sp. 4557]|uniref:Na(+)/H(+) antiporter subunit B n=1 Tax=Thermococcus sp. (strain CGMCC 1.5172 / 4557) TaxID=1042877 RepID=UPI000219EDD8|nr:MnhB domain-containing protein [Thermococcus sp. 4557]AEK72380.1 Multisubunit Na+/H+ antiporter, MnhB subunit [Thermococcus sp. 4557]